MTPTLDGDRLYAACNDGNMYAFTATDGTVKWRYAFDEEALSPTVPLAEGLLFYAGSGYNSDYSGTVHAVEAATGEPRWRTSVDHSLYSSAIVENGVFYVNGDDETALHALDVATGNMVGTFDPPPGLVARLSIANDTAYVAGSKEYSDGIEEGYASAFDLETGAREWVYRTNEPIVVSAPTIAAGRVYFSSDGTVYALDAETGELHWHVDAANTGFASWTATDDSVYLGSNDHLYAIDTDEGSIKWRAQTEKIVRENVVVDDGTVYAVDDLKYLYALDAETGDEHWRYELEAMARSPPTLGPETIYIGTRWSMEAVQR